MIRLSSPAECWKMEWVTKFWECLCAWYEKSWRKITNRPLSKDRGQEVLSTLNSFPTRLCHVIDIVSFWWKISLPSGNRVKLLRPFLKWIDVSMKRGFFQKNLLAFNVYTSAGWKHWPVIVTYFFTEKKFGKTLHDLKRFTRWLQVNRKENHRRNKKSTRPFSINTYYTVSKINIDLFVCLFDLGIWGLFGNFNLRSYVTGPLGVPVIRWA